MHRQRSKGKQEKKQNKVQRYFDYSLLFVVIFLVCFGLVMIYSTSSYSSQVDFGDSFHYLKRQAMWAGVGFLALLMISRIDYHLWSKFAFFGYIIMNLMLLAVQPAMGRNDGLSSDPSNFSLLKLLNLS